MLSPTLASVFWSSIGGSLWLNRTCGACWYCRRPSLNSYKRQPPSITEMDDMTLTSTLTLPNAVEIIFTALWNMAAMFHHHFTNKYFLFNCIMFLPCNAWYKLDNGSLARQFVTVLQCIICTVWRVPNSMSTTQSPSCYQIKSNVTLIMVDKPQPSYNLLNVTK